MNQHLAHALASATLAEAMEMFSTPVLLVDGDGRPRALNRAAALQWASGDLASRVTACLTGQASSFQVTEVSVEGAGRHLLLSERPDQPDLASLLSAAQRNWQLTAREAEVLEALAQGATNQAIGERLGCTLRTIEVHVTRLLEKAQVSNRATLIARFWTGEH